MKVYIVFETTTSYTYMTEVYSSESAAIQRVKELEEIKLPGENYTYQTEEVLK